MSHASATHVPNARPVSAAPAGVHAPRVIFVDLARALAVVFMLYGHTMDALLAPHYKTGTWYDVWLFQRGLTSTLFLMLSGFAFSIATTKHWSSHLQIGSRLAGRIRRFGLFVLLGYALHFPVTSYFALPSATEAEWRSFLAPDVLQLIGVSLILIQLLVLAARVRMIFTVATFVLAAAVVALTPVMWSTDWSHLPAWLASYMSPSKGALFPLFPWSAYVLFGSALGQLFGRRGSHLATYANWALLGPAALLLPGGLWLKGATLQLLGPGEANFVPSEVLIRTGSALVIVGLVAHGSRYLSHLPRIFGAVAQETLLIYFVHLCIVYGSIWSPGLSTLFGPTLHPLHVLAIVVALVASMSALAWKWNQIKHAEPRRARWVAMAVWAVLIVWLI